MYPALAVLTVVFILLTLQRKWEMDVGERRELRNSEWIDRLLLAVAERPPTPDPIVVPAAPVPDPPKGPDIVALVEAIGHAIAATVVGPAPSQTPAVIEAALKAMVEEQPDDGWSLPPELRGKWVPAIEFDPDMDLAMANLPPPGEFTAGGPVMRPFTANGTATEFYGRPSAPPPMGGVER